MLMFSLCSLKCVKRPSGRQQQVCILSPHPLVLADFSRILEGSGYKPVLRQLESMLAPELRRLPIPKATLYVVDAQASPPATAARPINPARTTSAATAFRSAARSVTTETSPPATAAPRPAGRNAAATGFPNATRSATSATR